MRHDSLLPGLISLAMAVSAADGLAQDLQLDASSISNAASYIQPNYPNGGIAHGGMFIVKGKTGSGAFGDCGTKVADAFPIATSMNGTSMKIAMAGQSFDVPMIYVVACSGVNQLAGIVPSNVPVGTGALTVAYNGHSGSAPITVVDRIPGLFTINQGGTGAAIIQNFVSASNLPINTLATPAQPGQYAIAWGTGLGPDGNSDVDAPKPTDLPMNLEFFVGGKPATVTYKGRSGCCAGIDQIVFQVPDGVDGCYVPVVAKIGLSVGNFTTMSVSASGGPCSDASGITAADVQAAQRNNKVRLGIVSLSRADSEASTAPNVGAVTRHDQAAAAFADLSFAAWLGLPVREVSMPGTCTVWRGNTNDLLLDRPPILAPYINLDAGTITIGGATGSAPLPYGGGSYSRLLGTAAYREPAGGPSQFAGVAFLEPGSFTVSSPGGGPLPGGKPIGAFNANIAVSAPPAFDNRFDVADVQRSQGVTVRWSAVDPAATVAIRGISVPNGPAPAGAAFFCVERAGAGQFTIPPSVLLSLPPSSSAGTLGLSVGVTKATRFTAPGVDIGLLRFSSLFGRNVNFH